MYRSLWMLLLLPLIVSAETVQSGTDDSAGQASGSVEGRVINAQTGDGISGASIRLIPLRAPNAASSAPKSTTSQADGSFTVDGVSPGTYLVLASQASFTEGADGARSRRAIRVGAGEAVSNVTIQLTPVDRIRGTVVDDEANPVSGARIEAFLVYPFRGKNQLRSVSQVNTDDQGRFMLKIQETGKYYIAAQPESASTFNRKNDEKSSPERPSLELVRTFYPKSLDIENATAVDLISGQDAPEVTIQLVRAAAHHIRGRIEGFPFDGRPHGPRITLTPRSSFGSEGLGTVVAFEKDGSFDIPGVVSGSYTLTVTGTIPSDNSGTGQSETIFRPRLLAREDVDVAADDVNGVVLAVIPLATLSGRITIDGLDNTDFSTVRVNLVSLGATMGGFKGASAQRDGSFQMQNVTPGQYMVRVSGAPSGTYVQSITYNRQDISISGIDLTQGGAGEIDIELRTGSGEVDGTLQTTDQISAISVMVLVPEALAVDASGVLIANMQSSGGFVIRNVPPGRYYAYAVDRWSPLWQNSDFLRRIQNQGTAVDLSENGHAQVQLSLISSDQVQAAAMPLGLTSR